MKFLTIFLFSCLLLLQSTLAAKSPPIQRLPNELLHSVFRRLPNSALATANGVNKWFQRVSVEVQKERPSIMLKKCLALQWDAALAEHKEKSPKSYGDSIQRDPSWKQCEALLQKPVLSCTQDLFDYRAPALQGSYTKVFGSSLGQNWCELALAGNFIWLRKLALLASVRIRVLMLDTLANMVEYLHDRSLAASIHRGRLQMVPALTAQAPVPFSLVAKIPLLFMDYFVRYLSLSETVVFQREAEISEALKSHFQWSAQAIAHARQPQQPTHLLHLPAVKDNSVFRQLLQHCASQLSHFIQREYASSFQKLQSGSMSAMDENAVSASKQSTADLTMIGMIGKREAKTPLYEVFKHASSRDAIDFYKRAYGDLMLLTMVIPAGASLEGTRLLSHMLGRLFEPSSHRVKRTVGILDEVASLVLVTACSAMLHTNASWAKFSRFLLRYVDRRRFKQPWISGLRQFRVDIEENAASDQRIFGYGHLSTEEMLAVERITALLTPASSNHEVAP